ncbi:MAG TPA: penicillin-binding transpeptidase domain-containing protein, partial [Patescibacteria group bacterium]|nr:penicillin-binding transpeptidase domain-containing protein [Patescibacteria group bacterium]
PLFNRATSGLYPPGSTFKIVTATAALEEKAVTSRTVIEDKGAISIGSYIYRGWKPEGLGNVSLREAIAKSSDIYFYTVGGGYGGVTGVGVKKLHDWAVRYGFGQGTNIDLPTESQGLVPDEEWKIVTKGEKWFLGNTYQMAIGQGDVLATPLQINMMTTVVANNGTLYAPQNVWKVRSPEGVESVFTTRETTRNVASVDTLRVIQEGMRMAAQPGGTAYPFFTFPIEVAGKTGTAEFGDPKNRTHAWFTAYAPYKNPEVAVTVLVEGQYGGGEGASVAAPIAKEIMQYYFLERKAEEK